MQNQSANIINVPAEDEEFLRQYDIKLANRGLSVVQDAWRIKLKSNNQFITLSSGKSLWSKIGHAKAALRNDFPRMWIWNHTRNSNGNYYMHAVSRYPSPQGQERDDREEAAFQKFITEYVEFVKIS
jgi:hypothetical protein